MNAMLNSYLSVCEDAARAAGKILCDMLGTAHVRHKTSPADLVTEADIAAQKAIETIVIGAFPEHRFLGEEENANSSIPPDSTDYYWIVDPLDGTTNFVHGVPIFSTSIALTQGTNVLCGVVYNPITEEFFSAAQGNGAFLNGKPIHVSSRQTLEESLAGIGLSTRFLDDSPDLLAFKRTAMVCQSVRRCGSTALNLAYVAAGRFDISWALRCHPWDIAAGVVLIKEAGGIVTKPDGSPIDFCDPSPICASANETLHKAIVRMLNPES